MLISIGRVHYTLHRYFVTALPYLPAPEFTPELLQESIGYLVLPVNVVSHTFLLHRSHTGRTCVQR